MESFYGKVENHQQAFALLTACMNGKLPKVTKRLSVNERQQIRNGSVFVFEEGGSGIVRWTDGRLWSHSRSHVEKMPKTEHSSSDSMDSVDSISSPTDSVKSITNYRGRFRIKPRGLCKQTMSLEVRGQKWHLISYIQEDSEESRALPTPECSPEVMPTDLSLEVMWERAMMKSRGRWGKEDRVQDVHSRFHLFQAWRRLDPDATCHLETWVARRSSDDDRGDMKNDKDDDVTHQGVVVGGGHHYVGYDGGNDGKGVPDAGRPSKSDGMQVGTPESDSDTIGTANNLYGNMRKALNMVISTTEMKNPRPPPSPPLCPSSSQIPSIHRLLKLEDSTASPQDVPSRHAEYSTLRVLSDLASILPNI